MRVFATATLMTIATMLAAPANVRGQHRRVHAPRVAQDASAGESMLSKIMRLRKRADEEEESLATANELPPPANDAIEAALRQSQAAAPQPAAVGSIGCDSTTLVTPRNVRG